MLTTDRLRLREINDSDCLKVHELHSLPETDEFNTLGIPENLEATERIVSEWLMLQQKDPRALYVFYIERIHDNQFIGLIALVMGKVKYRSAEVWYKVHKDFWRNGYTTEALMKVLEFGFRHLKLHRVEAGCAVENIGSFKVLEKAGMIREGRKRGNLPIRGEWKDNYLYGMLREDFDSHIRKRTEWPHGL